MKKLTGVDEVLDRADERGLAGRRRRHAAPAAHLRGVRAGRGPRAEPRRAADAANAAIAERLLGRPAAAREPLRRAAARSATRAPRSATSRRSSTSCAAIKSPREIALIRRASQLAGLGADGGDAQHGSRASTSTSSTPPRATSSWSTARGSRPIARSPPPAPRTSTTCTTTATRGGSRTATSC